MSFNKFAPKKKKKIMVNNLIFFLNVCTETKEDESKPDLIKLIYLVNLFIKLQIKRTLSISTQIKLIIK